MRVCVCARSGVARPRATGALARGVVAILFGDCSHSKNFLSMLKKGKHFLLLKLAWALWECRRGLAYHRAPKLPPNL